MTTTEEVERSMLELAPLIGITTIPWSRADWDTRFAGRQFGYVMPRPIGEALTPLHFCADILVEQAGTFVGTTTEAELLAGTAHDDPTADAIGVYVSVLQQLVMHEVAHRNDDDDVTRQLAAEAAVWDVARADLEFFKRVQARATMRLVTT